MQYQVDTKKVKCTHYCGNQLSIKQNFKDTCTEVLLANTDNEIVGKIKTKAGAQLLCDFKVIAILKTLVRMGSTSYEELAVSCRLLFYRILQSDSSYITVGKMLSCLSKETYELSQLSAAIKEVADE